MPRTFPRLRLDSGIPYPPDAALPVGTQFARVDPPNATSIDPKFYTWRMVLWEVVRVDNTWKRKKGSSEHIPRRTGSPSAMSANSTRTRSRGGRRGRTVTS